MPPPKPNIPPFWLDRFLRWRLPEDQFEEVQGDLQELYNYWVQEQGKSKANRLYLLHALTFLRPLPKPKASFHSDIRTYSQANPFDMIRNYLTIALRNMVRQHIHSFINITGLAAGMAVAILIGLWIYDELSFNTNHQNYDSIVKVYRKETWRGETQANTAHVTGLGTVLKNEYGDLFKQVVMVRAGIEDRVVASGDNKFTQSGYFMQPEGADMLTLQMVYGTRQGLTNKKSILLSETLSKKLFGDTNPVNQIIKMDAKWDLLVTGVYKDLPKNSEFREATYFAPLDLYLDGWATIHEWENYHMYIYAQLQPEADYKQVSAIIKDAMLPHVDEERVASKPEVFLLPMSQWHLYSKFENGQNVTSEALTFVRLYGIIGMFVLLLACINFMNLSTARSSTRAKEVGIRKTIGSMRSQLVEQFLSESILVAFLAFILSVLLVFLALHWFNEVADKEMRILWNNPIFWLAAISFTCLTGILAGSYPALYLSSFHPIKVLKGTLRAGRYAAIPRKVLVTFQFSVYITLIIGTIIVYQQIQYAKNRPVGYTREGLVSLRPQSPEYQGKYQVLRDELKKTGVIEEAAQANYPVTNTYGWNGGFEWKGKDPRMDPDPSFNTISVTYEYGKTVGWQFIAGRDFSREYATDKNAVVLNESAAKILGLENPVGEVLRWNPNWREPGTYQIVGVVKDMVKGSPFEPTDPSIIFLSEADMSWLYIRLKPNVSASEALPKIEKVFTSLIPSAPFDYSFADEEYNAKFRAEERIGKLASVFAFLAIFISCLGLFGLASFVAEQRTKEIGIRKVLGATLFDLWHLLSKEFVWLVMCALVIAAPIAWYFLSSWLENYAYRTQISGWIFVMAGIAALLITLCTVSFQAIKAALMNPVKSLRNE
ncbi:FtsX-like permease family protein [Rhodocytophaga rosea]|uniref:FtsX-like permease family protein n=1 Tax=Rhodocytophaga rosea TaxID=2704465 RepID=A0A6C0GFB4_9BACT|nr:ABC transporter permease [Rhodocytophaga rosea]QHT66453.1 FtsX-like permease family protein [Rhodocytophaga rosea]